MLAYALRADKLQSKLCAHSESSLIFFVKYSMKYFMRPLKIRA